MTTTAPQPVVSIVLPTYCEENNIGTLIEQLHRNLTVPVEFIVVDDNSPDGTAPEVEEVGKQVANVRLIIRKDERGLVSAIKRGIDEARGKVIVWMDCDLSMPPEKVPELVAQVLGGTYDAAIGSRYVPGGGACYEMNNGILVFIQKCLTRGLNCWTKWMLRASFNDWTSGFIAIRTEVVKQFPFQGYYGEYFIHLMAFLIKQGFSFIEVPYVNVPRKHGKSKTAQGVLDFLQKGVRYIVVVLRIRGA